MAKKKRFDYGKGKIGIAIFLLVVILLVCIFNVFYKQKEYLENPIGLYQPTQQWIDEFGKGDITILHFNVVRLNQLIAQQQQQIEELKKSETLNEFLEKGE